MKCVICHNPTIEPKTVNEESWINGDVVLVPVEALVCTSCGERYYDRRAMRKLEKAEEQLRQRRLKLEATGRVLKMVTAEPAIP